MADKWVNINLFVAQNDNVFARSLSDPELTPEDGHSILAYWRAHFHQWSNNYYQYSQGVLDETLFQPTLREISMLASYGMIGENLKSAWSVSRFIYSDGFCAFMDERLGESKVSTPSQKSESTA